MLELKEIKKSYLSGANSVDALDGVSVNFRDNEFVAILGPSGSGKTTLLNIIGGLDRYDGGELKINGRSTKKYRDKDWDAYRNHSVGFVFQSYNLIPHQTVLSNVELALTISGISKSERRKRAIEVLEKVGLGDQLHKKPNQMSGGQMQRVAIARALVNDPEILLADEPTGALDSKTSVQIMELIQEISKDRLVIMVTHNPELAEQYANRIIQIKDGKIFEDTNPCIEENHQNNPETKVAKEKHTSMSIKTALGLSFNNLLTKKARTLLTSFAGSIGIIGIALILALSNGIQVYIDSIQRNALTSYPITIEQQAMDIGAALGNLVVSTEDAANKKESNKVYSNTMTSALMQSFTAGVWVNDLAAFKSFIESDQSNIRNHISSIQYSYDNHMNIYTVNDDGEINQVSPSPIMSMISGMSIGGITLDSSTMSAYEKYINAWQELIDNQSLLEEQYDLIQGAWPQKYNEVVLIVDQNNEISDFVLQGLGVTNAADSMEAFMAMQNGTEYQPPSFEFAYDEILEKEFSLVLEPDFYQYDQDSKTWIDKHDDLEYTKKLINNGEKIKIVGILKPSENSTTTLMSAIGYTSALTTHVIEATNDCKIVKEQKKNSKVDVFTGLPFETIDNNEKNDLTKSAVEESTTAQETTTIKTVPQNTKLSILPVAVEAQTTAPVNNMFDFSNMKAVSEEELYAMIDNNYSKEEAAELKHITELILKSVYTRNDRKELAAYFDTALAGQTIEGIGTITGDQAVSYLQMMDKGTKLKMLAAIFQMSESGDIGVSVPSTKPDQNNPSDPSQEQPSVPNDEPTTEAPVIEEPKPYASSYEESLNILGVADLNKPKTINIYPIDFEAKEAVAEIISEYNKLAESNDEKEKVVKYTDYIGIMLSSVTTIINVISYILIAFVAVSLIVSSIMIGIITYISVLERTKEIGVLRAIGASKRNVSQVFNAETFIIGLCSGIIGIGFTALFIIPCNAIIHYVTGNEAMNAILPVDGAIILIVLSMLLTMFAGLIPSKQAAKKDPVIALRSE